jgi:putative transposase
MIQAAALKSRSSCFERYNPRMPRRLLTFAPECFYHLYNRGNNRAAIFFEPENYIYFLKGIKRFVLPVADVVAYCLMPTHYHLMVRIKPASINFGGFREDSSILDAPSETPEVSPVSSAMMRLSVSYTKAINKRFGRVGVLFQGPFRAKPLSDSRYLLQLCRYIHANPVQDGIVSDPSEWPYSNYLEWIGERGGSLFDPDFVQAQFPGPGSYKDFVAAYICTRSIPAPILSYLAELEI